MPFCFMTISLNVWMAGNDAIKGEGIVVGGSDVIGDGKTILGDVGAGCFKRSVKRNMRLLLEWM